MATDKFCGVEVEAGDKFDGVIVADADKYDGVEVGISAGSTITIGFASGLAQGTRTVSWVFTGRQVGDIISVYFTAEATVETSGGIGTAEVEFRENGGSWIPLCACDEGSAYDYVSTYRGNLDYDDTIEFRFSVFLEDEEDWAEARCQLTSAAITTGSGTADVVSQTISGGYEGTIPF